MVRVPRLGGDRLQPAIHVAVEVVVAVVSGEQNGPRRRW